MLKVKLLLPAVILCGILFVPALGGKWTLSIPKDTVVTIKIPNTLYQKQSYTSWSGRPTYFTFIDQDAGGNMTVEGKSDWKNAGWIWMADFAVKEVDQVKNKEWQGTEVSLTNANFIIRMRFRAGVADVSKAFSDLVYAGTLEKFQQTAEYKRDNTDKYYPIFFPGPLAKLTDEEKFVILKSANYVAKDKFGVIEYKGKNYVFINDETSEYYNNRRFSKPQRVSKLTNEFLLGVFKSFYKGFGKYGFEGLKLGYNIKHMDLVTSGDVGIDFVEIYAPADVWKAFAEDEIVGQEFIDRCIVLVDNNRTKIDLSLQ